jgi:hypothetical protein
MELIMGKFINLILYTILLITNVQARDKYLDLITFAESAEFSFWKLDHHFSPSSKIVAGKIKINETAREITLSVSLESTCLPGNLCAAIVVPPFVKIRLLMTDQIVDSCGVETFIAVEDKRLDNGLYKRIEVTSYKNYKCERVFNSLLFMTEVAYETRYFSRSDGKEVINSSFFIGKELDKI